jgi:hypothetical protein
VFYRVRLILSISEPDVRSDEEVAETLRAFFLPFWPFVIGLCHALLGADNLLPASDAAWLGLIDASSNCYGVMKTETFTDGPGGKALGISRQISTRALEAGHVSAPKPTIVGEKSFRLWTEAEIERARKFKGRLKPGQRRSRN